MPVRASAHSTNGSIALFLMLALVAPGGAQVDCSNPDNLCTGDPCVIPKIEPANPCVADFGARAVVILGGTIQATATGNVTTDGGFSVGPGGCIGLSAGGTVTTGSSTFDQTVQQTCP